MRAFLFGFLLALILSTPVFAQTTSSAPIHCGNRAQRFVVNRYLDLNPYDPAQMRLVINWAYARGMHLDGLDPVRILDLVILQVTYDRLNEIEGRLQRPALGNVAVPDGWWRDYKLHIVAAFVTPDVAWDRVCAEASVDVGPDASGFVQGRRDRKRLVGIALSFGDDPQTDPFVSYDRGVYKRCWPDDEIRMSRAVEALLHQSEP